MSGRGVWRASLVGLGKENPGSLSGDPVDLLDDVEKAAAVGDPFLIEASLGLREACADGVATDAA